MRCSRRECGSVSCQSLRRGIFMFDPAILLGPNQIAGPVELPLAQPGRRDAVIIGLRLNGLQPFQVLGLADAGEGQCYLPEPELEEPIAVSRLEIVIALGRGARDRVNLPSVQAQPLVGSAALRFHRARVRQEYSGETTLEYCRGDPTLRHIGEALGREYDGRVLPPQRLAPL